MGRDVQYGSLNFRVMIGHTHLVEASIHSLLRHQCVFLPED